jgi:hypothetical protein
MSASGRPIDGQTFAIGVLSVTACVLLVGFVLVSITPRQAHAIGQIDRGGDYIMLTQQISNSQEAVVVVDAASRRLNLYALDANTRKLGVILQGLPLDRLPGSQREAGGRR